ncbi:hypothetical protein ACOMHN_036362 [Nucella lapillus]
MAVSMKVLLTSAAVLMTCVLFRESQGHILSGKKRPNLLMIVVDDLGWNDIGAHDPNMVTPTIDRLYGEGFRLNHTYVDPSGSASRASLLSGKFSFRMGLQVRHSPSGETFSFGMGLQVTHSPSGETFSFRMGLQDDAINKYSDAHVPLNHTLLPMALKYRGYKTHMIGKWDQGFCNLDQTPTYRRFDTFFGHYTSSVNYTTKKTEEGYYNFRDGEEVMVDSRFTTMYNTDVLGKRAIAMINKHKSVFQTEERKQKCGMMSAVDISIFRVLRALEKTELDHTTLIFFTADGGGDAQKGFSNWPLRGSKGTVWEGGVRVPSFIWSESSDLLPVQNHTYRGFFHAVDWYPTLIGFAKKRGRPVCRSRSPRPWTAATTGGSSKGGWYSPPLGFNATDLEEPTLNYKRKPFLLFNVRKDPSETRDLSKSKVAKNAEARQAILDLYDDFKADYVSKQGQAVDSSPANHPEYNGVWSPGSC